MKKPTIPTGFADWVEDFWQLSSHRQIGTANGPLPHLLVVQYRDRLPAYEREVYQRCMSRMDAAFLGYVNGTEEQRKAMTPVSATPFSLGGFMDTFG